MPNWVYNELHFSNREDFENVVENYVTKTEEQDLSTEYDFDFNKIKPMPKSLEIVEGSLVHYATRYISEDIDLDAIAAVYDLTDDPIRPDWDELDKSGYNFAPQSKAEFIAFAKIIEKNIKEYGSSSWYYWCINNWGTKWNACRTSINHDTMTIYWETAWSPVNDLLTELFTNQIKLQGKVYYMYAEEQVNDFAGEILYNANGIEADNWYGYNDMCEDFFKIAAHFFDPDQEIYQWNGENIVCTNEDWSDEYEEYDPNRILPSLTTDLHAQLDA